MRKRKFVVEVNCWKKESLLDMIGRLKKWVEQEGYNPEEVTLDRIKVGILNGYYEGEEEACISVELEKLDE